jgi:hypothetical protein
VGPDPNRRNFRARRSIYTSSQSIPVQPIRTEGLKKLAGICPVAKSEKFAILSESGERIMKRSDRVFDALHTLRNRYMLCQLASKATRKFHKPNTRIQETMNEVLDRIASSERQSVLAEPEHFAEAQRRAA